MPTESFPFSLLSEGKFGMCVGKCRYAISIYHMLNIKKKKTLSFLPIKAQIALKYGNFGSSGKSFLKRNNFLKAKIIQNLCRGKFSLKLASESHRISHHQIIIGFLELKLCLKFHRHKWYGKSHKTLNVIANSWLKQEERSWKIADAND